MVQLMYQIAAGKRLAPLQHPAPWRCRDPAQGVAIRNRTRIDFRPTSTATATTVGACGGSPPVEAGTERVTDGIHSEPTLSKGKTYRLSLACAGKGDARLTFVPTNAGSQAAVPCDKSVVQQRLTAEGPVRIDVDGTSGSTGVIAWQIDAV